MNAASVSYGAASQVPPPAPRPLPNQPAGGSASPVPVPTNPSTSVSVGNIGQAARQVMANGDSNGDERVNYREFDAALRQRESLKAMRSGVFASTIGLYASIQMQQPDTVATSVSVRV